MTQLVHFAKATKILLCFVLIFIGRHTELNLDVCPLPVRPRSPQSSPDTSPSPTHIVEGIISNRGISDIYPPSILFSLL